MKLFKLELTRGRRGLEAIAHTDTAEAARARVASKYTGWDITNVLEIKAACHFVIAELDAPDGQTTNEGRQAAARTSLMRMEDAVTESHPVLERMKERGMPLTLENYLRLAYPEGAPDPMSGEELAMIPPEVRGE